MTQCLAIPTRYPNFFASLDPSDTVILVSPLRRTLQTMFLGFSSVLPPAAGANPIPVVILPQLQECGSWPCDTGGPLEETKAQFPQEWLDWSECERYPEWNQNSGAFKCDDEDNNVDRARWVRNYIRSRKEKHVVVVSHHGLLRRIVKAPYAHNRMKSVRPSFASRVSVVSSPKVLTQGSRDPDFASPSSGKTQTSEYTVSRTKPGKTPKPTSSGSMITSYRHGAEEEEDLCASRATSNIPEALFPLLVPPSTSIRPPTLHIDRRHSSHLILSSLSITSFHPGAADLVVRISPDLLSKRKQHRFLQLAFISPFPFTMGLPKRLIRTSLV